MIDPYKEILNSYRLVLEQENYLVETSKNLNEAYQQLSGRQYAVIITEYLSPFEEMYRMIKWVKENSPVSCIIMVSNIIIEEKNMRNFLSRA